jgi:hypothetical protein
MFCDFSNPSARFQTACSIGRRSFDLLWVENLRSFLSPVFGSTQNISLEGWDGLLYVYVCFCVVVKEELHTFLIVLWVVFHVQQMRYGASTEERCVQNMCGKCFEMPYSKLFFIFGMNCFDLVQML